MTWHIKVISPQFSLWPTSSNPFDNFVLSSSGLRYFSSTWASAGSILWNTSLEHKRGITSSQPCNIVPSSRQYWSQTFCRTQWQIRCLSGHEGRLRRSGRHLSRHWEHALTFSSQSQAVCRGRGSRVSWYITKNYIKHHNISSLAPPSSQCWLCPLDNRQLPPRCHYRMQA